MKELAEAYRQQMKRLGLKLNENEILTIFKEWEVERAKNINEIIETPSTSVVKGWLERKVLRKKIETADYSTYDKHIKARTTKEAQKFSLKEAQFLPELKGKLKGIYKEAIENAVDNGLFVKEGGSWYFFHKFEKPIGFNKGKEVSWIRVELTDNAKPEIHGHPITLERVRTYFPEIKGVKGQ